MYYITLIMKNNFLENFKYLYYFSLIVLLTLYLFPGSLIGYLLYGDLGRQPNFINNPFGTSINHFIFFVYLSILAILCDLKKFRILTNFYFILMIPIFLEIFHFIIPNRAFEAYDLTANMTGVILVFLIKKIFK